MRGPNEPDDGFRLPPKPAPAPAAPTTQQKQQSEFEKDDWLPDGLRRKKPPEKPEPCDLLSPEFTAQLYGWMSEMVLKSCVIDRLRVGHDGAAGPGGVRPIGRMVRFMSPPCAGFSVPLKPPAKLEEQN